jgi:8-oxo-dGTP pyrophosphatase MutT (NUDIX family)
VNDYCRKLPAFLNRAEERLLRDAGGHEKLEDGVRPAAVLVPIVAHDDELTVLLTQRSDELPTHAGQISFPGGKMDAGDATPLDAALREMAEETGIGREFASPVGYLDTFNTGSGYSIVPVVAVLRPGFTAVPEPGEVTDIFEVPLAFLMDPANHVSRQGMWRGKMHQYYEMPYGERYIWGVTASMLRELSRRLNGYD